MSDISKLDDTLNELEMLRNENAKLRYAIGLFMAGSRAIMEFDPGPMPQGHWYIAGVDAAHSIGLKRNRPSKGKRRRSKKT